MNEEIIKLDVIPIFKNEIYPTYNMFYHFTTNLFPNENKDYVIDKLIDEIKYKLRDYDLLIILENGKVIAYEVI